MLSQRAIEKRVADALASDDRWRVIVRGNNWLCPYCLRIGARDLRMDEAIEGKLALHFARECDSWDYFDAEPEDMDELRHQARLLVFKLRALRWITEDRRFRFFAGDQWICPYDLARVPLAPPAHALEELQAWGEAPEESPFLEGVVGHLVGCAGFARGEDKLRDVRELDEARTRHSRRRGLDELRARIRAEESFQLVDQAGRWICPYCANAQDFQLGSKELGKQALENMATHLSLCKARKVLGGRPRPVGELRDKIETSARERQLDKVKRKILRHAIWRIRDLELVWYCPYGAHPTLVAYPAQSPREGDPPSPQADRFFRGVLAHLRECEDYRRPQPSVCSRETMADVIGHANEAISRRRRVRRLLTTDRRFGVVDDFFCWLCPYCQRLQRHVSLQADEGSATFEKTIEQITRHLYDECDQAHEDAPSTSRADLEALVRRSSLAASGVRERGVATTTDSMDAAAWSKIKRDIDQLATEAAARESSLKEARSKQLRLLPSLPELPGYDFGRVYKPCDAVGGDFYHLFPALDGCFGVAIGDIAGHGIEAALLMGLAKKLIEVHGRGLTSAAQALCLTNQDIFTDLDERTFVTAFYGVLDVAGRRFRFARAGHNALILYNPQRAPTLQVIDQRGMALGVDEGPLFEKTLEELEIALQPGDLVLQFTDGVTETLDAAGEQFGDDRLCAVVREHGHHEVEYVLWKIERALDAFRGDVEQGDDVTMIGFKVLA